MRAVAFDIGDEAGAEGRMPNVRAQLDRGRFQRGMPAIPLHEAVRLRAAGRIRTEGKETDRLSMHDPCNLARKSGVIRQQRNLIGLVAEDFVDMKEHGRFQWCCGAGGGVSSNERAEHLKMAAFKMKKAQIEAIEPERLVTMCATCRTQLEEGLEAFNMDIPVVGLTEMIAEHLVDKTEADEA